MDLSLLPHLSERALRDEAERRGVAAEGLDRAQLMEAIRAHEARAITVPPAHVPAAYAPTEPPRAAGGPLGAARAILGRVIGLARGALEPRSEPPPPPAEPAEPIRTRSLARLLEEQGHLERAIAILRDLERDDDDPELRAWRARLERETSESALRARARALLAREGSFVEILGDAGARAVVWRVDEAGLARARALLGASGALTLRVVRVLSHPDRSVESRQEDRRPLEASGWALLDVGPSAKVVASVGVAAAERFVSVAHAAG